MYSNVNNSYKDRCEFLEETVDNIIKSLKHLGADLSDLELHPLEQLIAREFSKLKNRYV